MTINKTKWSTPVTNPYEWFDENTINQMNKVMEHPSARFGALCADGHYGYAHPIGGVVGYSDKLSISGVGYDIGCGNTVFKTDVKVNEIRGFEQTLGGLLMQELSFGVGAKGKKDPKVLEYQVPKDAPQIVKDLESLAQEQLGSVGGGNHYVNLMEGEDGFLWIATHFGSRGFGHKITSHFLKLVGAKDSMDAEPTLLDAHSPEGQEYLEAVQIAQEYAALNRKVVMLSVWNVLDSFLGKDVTITKRVECHHNFLSREMIKVGMKKENLYVVRKGATFIDENTEAFVGGSMGDPSYVIKGTKQSYRMGNSTVHGAGRVMSRTQAKKQVDYSLVKQSLLDSGIHVFGGDSDESPCVYKSLESVLRYHSKYTEIVEQLLPVVVCMAPRGVTDPYKD
jgi:tRNA-splicing ligase RtcB